VGLLPASAISSLAYTHMLDTLLCNHKPSYRHFTTSTKINSSSSANRQLSSNSSNQPKFHSLVALLRLAGGNTTADVALRGDLLKHLTKYCFYQEAVDLAALCVMERRWLGTETLNALLRAETDALHGAGAAAVNTLIHTEHAQLIGLLDQAQSVLSAFGAGALILPPAVQRVTFMGQTATSNSPARDTPRKARTCSSFELVLRPDEALLVRAGTLDFDALLPPQDLVLGPDCGTVNANVSHIERYLALDPAAHRVTAVRRLLETIAMLGRKEVGVEADMDVLVFIARLGHRTHSMLVVNRAVELALRLGQLSDRYSMHMRNLFESLLTLFADTLLHPFLSQRATADNDDIRYSWQVPSAISSSSGTIVQNDLPTSHFPHQDTASTSSSSGHAGGIEMLGSENELGGAQDGNKILTVEPSQPTLYEMQMVRCLLFCLWDKHCL